MNNQGKDIERKTSVLKKAEVPEEGKNPHITPPSLSKRKSVIPQEIIEAISPVQPQRELFRQMAETMKKTDLTFHSSVALAAALFSNIDISLGAAIGQINKEIQVPDLSYLSSFTVPQVLLPVQDLPISTSLAIKACLDPLKYLQLPIISCSTIGLSEIAAHNLSPTMQIADYFSPLIAEKNTEEKVGVILEKSLKKPQVDIEKELLKISRSQCDIIFNFQGYQFLFELEVFLRDLIQERIIAPCQNQKETQNYIPSSILDEWESRKSNEEDDWRVSGSYRSIDYSDFTHLKMIFERGRNIKKFEDLVNQQDFQLVVGKLHELDPIRKKIAHSRLLTVEDFSRLEISSSDIQRLFGNS